MTIFEGQDVKFFFKNLNFEKFKIFLKCFFAIFKRYKERYIGYNRKNAATYP